MSATENWRDLPRWGGAWAGAEAIAEAFLVGKEHGEGSGHRLKDATSMKHKSDETVAWADLGEGTDVWLDGKPRVVDHKTTARSVETNEVVPAIVCTDDTYWTCSGNGRVHLAKPMTGWVRGEPIQIEHRGDDGAAS